jgi:uracil-DNA glycosylase family 4
MELAQLLAEVEAEARRAAFPVDAAVYAECGRDPAVPILAAGSLTAPICSFGRDLGRHEVRHGQPQVGAAGRLVRSGVLRAHGLEPERDDPLLLAALEHVFLTNTVPYKPPGNRPYAPEVKERFRPFVERLLVEFWHGDCVVTLGNEALEWFSPYLGAAETRELLRNPDRYETEVETVIRTPLMQKRLRLRPLPHPSPLNRRWQARFPALLRAHLHAHLRAR